MHVDRSARWATGRLGRRTFIAGLAAAGVSAAAPAAIARPVFTVPDSIPSGPDVSAQLTAWLASVPDGAVADLLGRTFRCDTHVKLVDRRSLQVRNGTLTRARIGALVWPAPNPHLWFLRPEGCEIRDLTIRGTNTVPDQRAGFGSYRAEYEFEAAVRMERFTNCRIVGLTVDAVWGDGVQWQVGTGGYLADTVIDRNGRQGVTIIGTNMLCERVRVAHSRRSGFDLEPDTAAQAVSAIEIRNSYTNTIGLAVASKGRGAVNDVWIHHNRFDGPAVPVVYCFASDGSRRRNWRIEDNSHPHGLGSPAAAILMVAVDNVAVARNVLNVVPRQSRKSVAFSQCGGMFTIKDNDFGAGIYLDCSAPQPSLRLSVSGNRPQQQFRRL